MIVDVKIQSGDTLVCGHCTHGRVVEADWIRSVSEKYFPRRDPPALRDSDLGRFRCSSCGGKSLLRRAPHIKPLRRTSKSVAVPGQQLATVYLDQASDQERAALLFWATQLMAIRNAELSKVDKAKQAIKLTIDSGAVLPFVTFLGSELKRVGWDQRGLPERLALSAAAVTALTFSGQGAGIAALGGAIGVPLWVVFGAGGALAGVIVDEIKRRYSSERRPGTTKPKA
jgi:hypothetical protein